MRNFTRKTAFVLLLVSVALACMVLSGVFSSLSELFLIGRNDPNGRINFWGRVVDVEGKPVPEVKVTLSIRRWSRLNLGTATRVYYDQVTRRTDQEGRFDILDHRGDSLTVERLDKIGFAMTERQRLGRSFSVARVHGASFDPGQPVTFTLISRDSAAPQGSVISTRSLMGVIPCDGTPLGFDLLSRRTAGTEERCDIVVRIDKEGLAMPQRKTEREIFKYDWKVELSAVEGGIAVKAERLSSFHEEDLELMYKAPEVGYKPSYRIEVSKDSADWSPSRILSFYFQSRNGKHFGRAVMEIRTDGEKAWVMVRGDLNQEGSPKLQLWRR